VTIFALSLLLLLSSRFLLPNPLLNTWGSYLFLIPTIFYCAAIFLKDATNRPSKIILPVGLGVIITILLSTTNDFVIQKIIATIIGGLIVALIEKK